MTTADRPDTAIRLDPQLAAVFPPSFLWGVASSAYQVEGAVHEDGRGLSIWDVFSATPGKTYQGETGAVAADHYHRMPEDVALMAQLGIGAYRFSIAWPRILPEGVGRVNQPGLDFYDRLVDTLLAHGIQPFATLYHWDLPAVLQERGGWVQRDTASAFADYAEIVARRLGDRVARWITLNEPWCAAFLGYGNGEHAPGLHDPQSAAIVGHHLLVAHALAVPRLRATSSAPVGITLDFSPVYTADDRPETAAAAARLDTSRNRWFADPIFRGSYPTDLFDILGVNQPPIADGDMAAISTPVDFLGVNYYSRMFVRASEQALGAPGVEFIQVPGAVYTKMGWEVFPQGLTDLLVRLHRDYAPPALCITENGAAFGDEWNGDAPVHDPLRQAYLVRHIEAVARAIEQGAPVASYIIWSFIDNYEWAHGYKMRFGIVYVDYPTQRRIVKASGRWYADFLASQRHPQH